jgi:hypothetical protein
MKTQTLVALFLLAVFSVSPVLAQRENCIEFQKLVDATYNFKPSKLTPDERTTKSAAMDKVWTKVKANRQKLLPCLYKTINSQTSDSFFRFDASNLLIQLDESSEAKKTLIKAYAQVDFDDIDLRYWMPYIAILGYEGFDTSAAGENWLKHPNPEYYLPQHGTLGVNKEIGAFIIYGSMNESIATPALAKIALQENHSAREIAIRILMQQATPESFQTLKKLNQKGLSDIARQSINTFLTAPKILAPREGEPKVTRQQYLDVFNQLVAGKAQPFLKLATEVSDGEKDAVAVLKQEDIPLIRKARRFFAASANPHSAEWYKSFTDILMALTWKPELIKKV